MSQKLTREASQCGGVAFFVGLARRALADHRLFWDADFLAFAVDAAFLACALGIRSATDGCKLGIELILKLSIF